MKKQLIGLILAFISVLTPISASAKLWQDSSLATQQKFRGMSALKIKTNQIPRFAAARLLDLNITELKQYLELAPDEGSTNHALSIELPLPYGEFAEYLIYNSPVMTPELAAKFPEISTYKVIERDNPANTGRLDLTPDGFHAVLTYYGNTVYIDPIGTANQYQSYFKEDYTQQKISSGNHQPFQCNTGTHTVAHKTPNFPPMRNTAAALAELSFGTQIRKFRLAMAVTGEFTQYHGGTKILGMAAVVTGVNRINEIYERDLAIKLELVSNNDKLIYTDPATDPFDPSNEDLSSQVSAVINKEIGLNNFDVGHIIHGKGVGGQAGLGVVCDPDQKAVGETASDTPINDAFFIDFVAHELGHQFGSQHSFNATTESCGGGNRATNHAYEPASGTTVMGYAGICGEENLQANSDAHFHSDSIRQIQAYLTEAQDYLAENETCGVPTGNVNKVPVSNAGVNNTVHYIPTQTPFALTGSGTDADGDELTYSWEQLDLGPATSSKAGQVDDGQRPIFRSFLPTRSPTRTFPKLSDILTNTTTYGELMPSTSRELNFRLTVRDGKGGVASAQRKVQVVKTSSAFKVTLPDNANWQEANQNVTWDVAGTTAAPISCSAVTIELSSDGGHTFPTILLAETPNDGSQAVTLPVISTTSGRVRVSCTSQPFFAINSSDMTINNDEVPKIDTDKDGIPDETDTDDDNDGVSDTDEVNRGTEPLNPDTDGDGKNDGAEGIADSDGDGRIDALESATADADGDGIMDEMDNSKVLEYRISYSDVDRRYHVYMRPTVTPTTNSSLTGQVTIVVPHADTISIPSEGLTSHIENTTWTADSHSKAPASNPDKDYISFTLSGNGSFSWVAGTELKVFSFTTNTCPSDVVTLMEPGDTTFVGTTNNHGNQFTNLGWGSSTNNNYLANYGDAADCRDNDNDGISNSQEKVYGTNPDNADTDADGGAKNDLVEIGSELAKPKDSDGDGKIDALESATADADSDGVPDERDNNDNSGDHDTDGDGYNNALEKQAGSNPEDANSKPVDTDNDNTPDVTDTDDDGDGVPDADEITRGTNPLKPDTDGDGKNDAAEGTGNADGDDKIDALESAIADTDSDGVPDERDSNDTSGDHDTDGDGYSNTAERLAGTDPENPDSKPEPESISLQVRVWLQGAFDGFSMSDELRKNGQIPTQNPFGSLIPNPFTHHQGSETASATLLARDSLSAPVDWVLVELRNAITPTTILATRAALLLRNGDVVDAQSGSAEHKFTSLTSGNYQVAIRHRNHLGAMTLNPVALTTTPTLVDFGLASTETWGKHARLISGDKASLWAGDTNHDGQIIVNGPGNDLASLLSIVLAMPDNTEFNANYIANGYLNADFSLDGKSIFSGGGNDSNLAIGNIILHPGNPAMNGNYIMKEQLP